MQRSDWIPVESSPPPDNKLLIWTDGGCVVAVPVDGVDANGPWRVFMDARSDEILPWPSHWMPLPPSP